MRLQLICITFIGGPNRIDLRASSPSIHTGLQVGGGASILQRPWGMLKELSDKRISVSVCFQGEVWPLASTADPLSQL